MPSSTSALSFQPFGSPSGCRVVYFHGAPGAPAEAALFDACAAAQGVQLVCFDRFAVPDGVRGEAYFRQLADELAVWAAGAPVVLVGFSMGAYAALQTSRFLGQAVSALHLVSAAAPLEAGDFLPHMAGQPVFRLARQFPGVLAVLSHWQGLMARWFPRALWRMLFASAQGSDRRLAEDAGFQRTLGTALRGCFTGRVRGYVRELVAYVQPWHHTLAQVQAPTWIWHGAQDNWSPVAMATYLQSALPHCQQLQMMDGASHYGCLLQAMPQICALVASTGE